MTRLLRRATKDLVDNKRGAKKVADAIVSAAGIRIIKLLVGNEPQTVSNLIRATGVTRTAVTEQLNELSVAGFVERSTERLPGRGRPRHLYKATDAALVLLFASNQRLVVPAIWQAIVEICGEEYLPKVMKRVSRILAEHYNNKVTSKKPEDRFHELMDAFVAEGGLLDIDEEDGQLVIHKRSCPFISMVDENRSICRVDLDMMSQVVGRPIHRTACRHDGDPCCKFELDTD